MIDAKDPSKCTCEYSRIQGADPMRLKLSGDFQSCGILKFELQDRLSELKSIASNDIEKLEREYFRV
jgi:hypothetical protein